MDVTFPLGDLQVVSNLPFNALDDFCHRVDVIRRAGFLPGIVHHKSVLCAGQRLHIHHFKPEINAK